MQFERPQMMQLQRQQ